MTWIEVTDTAVKIGLGALITATSGFVLLWKNHKHEIKKERWRRAQDTLEEISREFELVHNHLVARASTNFYTQKSIESINKMLGNEIEDTNKQIDRILKQTRDDFLGLYTLEGKLLLLAGKDEEKLLREYRLTATKLEDIAITSKDVVERLRPVVNELHQKREIFYESISKLYKKP